MEKFNNVAGIAYENELDEMLADDTTVGGVASSLPCATIVATITLTFGWDFCPTNAFTSSCRF